MLGPTKGGEEGWGVARLSRPQTWEENAGYMSTGIVRLFRGVVRAGAQDDFGAYLDTVGVPRLLAMEGLQALDVAQADDKSEYVVLTTWKGDKALSRFVGAKSWKQPTLSAAEKRMLAQATVQHYRHVSRFERLPLLDDPQASDYPHPPTRVRIDADRGVAFVDSRMFELPPLEFQLLETLASAPGKILSPSELSRELWVGSTRVHPYDVRKAVYRLRKLLGPELGSSLIRTRPGFGYFLDS
jgi:hypothetical protein